MDFTLAEPTFVAMNDSLEIADFSQDKSQDHALLFAQFLTLSHIKYVTAPYLVFTNPEILLIHLIASASKVLLRDSTRSMKNNLRGSTALWITDSFLEGPRTYCRAQKVFDIKLDRGSNLSPKG